MHQPYLNGVIQTCPFWTGHHCSVSQWSVGKGACLTISTRVPPPPPPPPGPACTPVSSLLGSCCVDISLKPFEAGAIASCTTDCFPNNLHIDFIIRVIASLYLALWVLYLGLILHCDSVRLHTWFHTVYIHGALFHSSRKS